MKRLSRLFDLLMGNGSATRANYSVSRSRRLQMEPLEIRTLLSFTAGLEQVAAPTQLDPTHASPIHFTATFGSDVSTFPTSAVSLADSTIPLTDLTVATTQTSARVWDVAVTVGGTAGTHDGIVAASILAGQVANAAGTDTNAVSTSSDNEVHFDDSRPGVSVELASGQGVTTTSPTVHYVVTFSEAVTGFDATKLDLSGSTAHGASVTSSTPVPSSNAYDVTVSGLTGDGTVVLKVLANQVQDAALNGNTASTTSGGNTVTYNLPLTVVVEQANGVLDAAHTQADPTNTGPIHFTAKFSEPINVSTFTAADLSVALTGGITVGTPVLTDMNPGTDTIWDIQVTPTNASAVTGTVAVSIPATKVQDLTGEDNPASTSTDNSVTFDTTAPSVTISQTVGQDDPAATLPLHFTVTFSEPVTNFENTDLTGVPNGATCTVTPSGTAYNTTYDVTIGGLTGDTTVALSITAGKAHDAAGNVNTASTGTDNSILYDLPLDGAIAVSNTQANPTNAGPIHFLAQLNEPVVDLTAAKIDVSLSDDPDTLTKTVTSLGYNATTHKYDYDIAISGMSGTTPTDVRVQILEGTLHDAIGTDVSPLMQSPVVVWNTQDPYVTVDEVTGQPDPAVINPLVAGSPAVQFVARFNRDMDPSSVLASELALSQVAGGTLTLDDLTQAVQKVDARTYLFTVTGFNAGEQGTLIATMPAHSAQDTSDNWNTDSTTVADNHVAIDTTALTTTVVVAKNQSNPATTFPINFTVTFNRPVVDFDASKVFVTTGSGSPFTLVTQPQVTVTGSGATYNVSLSGMTRDGAVMISVSSDSGVDGPMTVHDGWGNDAAGATGMVYYDLPLTVDVEQAANQAGSTNASPIHFTVQCSEPVVDLNAAKIDLSQSTDPGPLSVSSVSSAPVYNATTKTWDYDVTVVGMSGLTSDLVIARMLPTATLHDAGGQVGTVSTSADNQVTYDAAAPTLLSIVRHSATPTNATSLQFDLTFSELVTGVDASDFALALTGTAAGTISSTISGSGATYTLTVTGVTGDGTLGVNQSGAGSIADLAGNGLTGTPVTGQTYAVDHTAATVVSVNRHSSSLTNATSLQFDVTFSEPVTGVEAGDFALALADTAVGTISSTIGGSGATYTVTVTGVSGDGTLGLNLASAGGIADLAGNGLTGAPVTGQAYTVDHTAPTVVSINRHGPSLTNATTLQFDVTFSEPVTGVDLGDFATVVTDTVSGAFSISGSGAAYTVTVTGVSGDGTLGLNLSNASGIADLAGNGLTGTPVTGQSYAVDHTAPTVVSINRHNSSPTNATSLQFDVTFSEPVAGVAASNFALATTATAAGAISSTISGSGATYTITVTGVTGDGTLGLNLSEAGGIADLAGNGLSDVLVTGQTYTVDNTVPTVVSINRHSSSPTNATSLQFDVTFSEPVTGVDAGDFRVATTDTAAGAIFTVIGSGSSYTVMVTGVSGDGTLGLNLVDDDTIVDAASNKLSGTGTSVSGNGSFSGEVYTVDNTPPTVTLSAPTSVAAGGVLNIAVHVSESVTPNTSAQATFGGTAPGSPDGDVTGSGQDYILAVYGMTGSGTVTVSLPAGAGTDAAGNPSAASNTVTIDYNCATTGFYNPVTSQFQLKNANAPGASDASIAFGNANGDWIPLTGDWDGDHVDTIGLYDPATSTFYLSNSANGGTVDETVMFGRRNSNWIPIAGDWNGDGMDTVGFYDPTVSTFRLKNTLTGGKSDVMFAFGKNNSGWTPVVGDWDGNGTDTVGFYEAGSSTFRLKNSLAGGLADGKFVYNPGGSMPVVGDWDGDGTETIGLYNPTTSTFYLRNTNHAGDADVSFVANPPSASSVPIAGTWIWSGHAALAALGGEATVTADTPALAEADVAPIVQEAISRWTDAGLDTIALQKLANVKTLIADLPGAKLAQVQDDTVVIDSDAAGYGWFVDSTPAADAEFTGDFDSKTLQATDPQAVDRIDLLTVVEHELGQIAGLDDLNTLADDVMSNTLGTGVRRLTT
jgi:hypothetical protein